MTRDEAVVEIQEILSFRTDQVAGIERRLQRAQVFAENGPTLPWFLQSERTSVSTIASEERLPIPIDFLKEAELSALWYVPTDTSEGEVELVKDDLDFLRVKFPRTSEDVPTHYALDNLYFRLFPTPDAVYSVKMIYNKKDTVLTSDIENLWLKHAPWVLIGRAGQWLAMALRDKTAREIFISLESEARLVLNIESEDRQHVNRRYQMGGGV